MNSIGPIELGLQLENMKLIRNYNAIAAAGLDADDDVSDVCKTMACRWWRERPQFN